MTREERADLSEGWKAEPGRGGWSVWVGGRADGHFRTRAALLRVRSGSTHTTEEKTGEEPCCIGGRATRTQIRMMLAERAAAGKLNGRAMRQSE
jgi:hypothetical protein